MSEDIPDCAYASPEDPIWDALKSLAKQQECERLRNQARDKTWVPYQSFEKIKDENGRLRKENEHIRGHARLLLGWLGMEYQGQKPVIPTEDYQLLELAGRCLALRESLAQPHPLA